ncbi:hypothetical protein [Faecalispora jeddahensis]|uniref:hypothetical protein n=1 Tax=Faecalispora jeddahensis TaxID=1414721 RepID=UPI0018985747|nr:hypothetical protein [Faecalispora jeddahensis]
MNEKHGKAGYGGFIYTVILVVLVPVFVSYFLFWYKTAPFYDVLPTKDQWTSLAGGLLAYVGTCFIGLLTLWQNIRFKIENDKSQFLLNSFNQRLLNVEEKRVEPVFDIGFDNKWSCGGELGKSSSFELKFINIGETPILYMNIQDVEVNIKGSKYGAEDAYIGGLASKESYLKVFIVKDGTFAHEDEADFHFLVEYKDILGKDHKKKVQLLISGKSDRRPKIVRLEIESVPTQGTNK